MKYLKRYPFNRLVIEKPDSDTLVISSSRLFHSLQGFTALIVILLFAAAVNLQYLSVIVDLGDVRPSTLVTKTTYT